MRGNVENALKVERLVEMAPIWFSPRCDSSDLTLTLVFSSRILTHEREKLDKFAPSIAGNRAPGNSEWMKMNVPVTVKSKL